MQLYCSLQESECKGVLKHQYCRQPESTFEWFVEDKVPCLVMHLGNLSLMKIDKTKT